MSKFNFKNTNKTVNREGFPAYKMQDKEQLVTAVLTTMFGEPKFYGSTDSDIFVLATVICGEEPSFVAKLACYARNVANMRSVSHVLACIIAHEAHEYTRAVIRNIIVRPDDITEIMACYKQMYGKPFPNALKREIAVQIQRFDEYALAKYNSRGMSMKFRDVLRITHPTPKNAETEALFRKVLDDTLETPYTWETELSEKGNTKEVWDELIQSGKVGYMALLRNLRNIVKCGADIAPVVKVLSDPERVKKSRQLPFRFFSAYRMLEQENLMTPDIHRALEKALTVSTENLDTIPGRTLIAVDVSGSMGSYISRKSTVMCSEIAGLLGAMSSRICEDATVCYFDCPGGWSCLKPFDRVIYFSDNVCNSYSYGIKTVQSWVDKYRNTYNPDFWVHGVDLQGYGTQQFCGKNFNLIAGWSEKVLGFILLAEKGIGSLVQTIEEYQMK